MRQQGNETLRKVQTRIRVESAIVIVNIKVKNPQKNIIDTSTIAAKRKKKQVERKNQKNTAEVGVDRLVEARLLVIGQVAGKIFIIRVKLLANMV